MKIVIAGDYCPQHRVSDCVNQSDYKSVLGEIKDFLSNVDYSIVNFECPVTDSIRTPIDKSGPNLHCTISGLDAIKWAGFDCVTLANNHFRDFGDEGVSFTINKCKQSGIDIVGGGTNIQEAERTLYKNINGKVLAIINCCEHEFSIASEQHGGANPLNPIAQFYAIKEARSKADYILVIIHGGHEHFQYPSIRMVETYRFFIDAGADVVVNHHQHCYSGYEVFKGKPIFYGLGNFCFDNNRRDITKWNYGYMVVLDLGTFVKYAIIPYEQCTKLPTIRLLEKSFFDITIAEINKAIMDSKRLQQIQEKYYSESIYNLRVGLVPISNRIIRSLLLRRILTPFLPPKWLVRLENYTMCEAHRDKLKYMFDNIK